MNKKITATFLAFAMLTFLYANSVTNIEVIAEENNAITLKFSAIGFDSHTVTTPEGEASIISIQNGTPMLKAGAPDLPKLTASVIIDNESNYMVNMLSGSFTDYENVFVAPSKGMLYRDINPDEIPFQFGEVYTQDDFFPQNQVSLRSPYIFRDFRGQTVIANPVQYNPVTKTLRVYNEMIVQVKAVSGNGQNALNNTSPAQVSKDFKNLYQKRFVNYNHHQDRYDQISELGNMLIIAASPFVDMMADFVAWKKQKGIPTEIVDVATVGNTETAVASYVSDYYHNKGLTFLLLVGDENGIPTMQTVSNNACDNCYGYIAGNDHYPEFFVGRFNGENETHIQTMIDRTMAYEKSPDTTNPAWFSSALGAGSNEGPGDDDEFDFEHLNNIKIELMDYHYQTVYEFYQGSQAEFSPTPGDLSADEAGNPTAASIVEYLSTNGASLYNYTGHGDHSVLATGNFDVDAINSMNNVGMYPFLVAVACCVGDFQGDFGSGPCLGDAWIRATDDAGLPTGGIGGCFSSILQSWAPPMEGQDEMVKLLTENGAFESRHTMGGIVMHGCASMNDAYGIDGDEMTDTWNIFGDPSVVLRTNAPTEMIVSHPAVIFLGESSMSVGCDVEGAMVGLYYQDELIGTGFVEGGNVTVNFDPVTYPEEIVVTVTAYNTLPYQEAVDVIAAEGPFVILNDYNIDDTNGNNNQLVDYGESVLLDVNLANVGVALAETVSAVISIDDDEIILLDDEDSWGNINPDTNAMVSAAFAFTAMDGIADQHLLHFDLEITDVNSNVYPALLSMKVNAPDLSTSETFVVDDSAGDGNGRFEQGETILLSIPSVNVGHSTSQAATGILTTQSEYIVISEPVYSLGTLPPDGNWINAVYEIQVAAEVPDGTPVEFEYFLEAGNYTAMRTYSTAIDVFVEDFESGDFSAFEWNTTEALPWFTTDLDPYEGAYCSQSGYITHDESTALELTVNVLAEDKVEFYRKVSSEESYDFLRFFIDDVEYGAWSGEEDWALLSYDVAPGEHTFRWEYAKDFIVSAGTDAAWVDAIVLPVHEVVVKADEVRRMNTSMSVAPNPFSTTTQIRYQLAEAAAVTMKICNGLGVEKLLYTSKQQPAGNHQFVLDGTALAPGIYFVQIHAGNDVVVKKVAVY